MVISRSSAKLLDDFVIEKLELLPPEDAIAESLRIAQRLIKFAMQKRQKPRQ